MDPDSGVGKVRNPYKRLWLRYQFSFISYFALAVTVLFIYHVLSDGDFSFLMTLGSVMVAFAFSLLVLKVVLTRSVSGISLKSLQGYALVSVGRLASILFYEGYLPFDRSGDWFYQVVEVVCLLMVLGLIAAITLVYPKTYKEKWDRFGNELVAGVPNKAGVVWLMAPALLLAMLLHPSLNNNWMTDTAWTFALYLEAVAILPQLFMFVPPEGRVDEPDVFEVNFVFCTAVARVMHFVFWLSSYHELNDKTATGDLARRFPGHLVVLAQVINLVCMGDFVYHHLTSARRGLGFSLPRSSVAI